MFVLLASKYKMPEVETIKNIFHMPGSRCQWLRPVILATQETDIRRVQFEASQGK
jgi:hypothetical protein